MSKASIGHTHCPKGHPYDEANTRIDGRGFRRCIACLPTMSAHLNQGQHSVPTEEEAALIAKLRVAMDEALIAWHRRMTYAEEAKVEIAAIRARREELKAAMMAAVDKRRALTRQIVKSGLTQKALAALVGATPENIGRWTQGTRKGQRGLTTRPGGRTRINRGKRLAR